MKIYLTLIIMLVSTLLFAEGLQERDVFPPMFKSHTVSYAFPLWNGRTNDVLTKYTNDVITFKVKKNEADATFAITKTCVYGKKIRHYGVVGTLAKGNSVTGAVSGATATIGYVNTREDYIWLTGITGTFQADEQVYQTLNTNYVTLSETGVDIAIAALSSSDTNIAIGDYYVFFQLTNTDYGEDEILLKSKLRVIYGTN